MQYRKFFIIWCCKCDLSCIPHLARFLIVYVKNYWNCPRKPVFHPAGLDNALKIMLAHEPFKRTKDAICNVFNIVSELIAYLHSEDAGVQIFFVVRYDKSVYEPASVGQWDRAAADARHTASHTQTQTASASSSFLRGQSGGRTLFAQRFPTTIFLPVGLHLALLPLCMVRSQCWESPYHEVCCTGRYFCECSPIPCQTSSLQVD